MVDELVLHQVFSATVALGPYFQKWCPEANNPRRLTVSSSSAFKLVLATTLYTPCPLPPPALPLPTSTNRKPVGGRGEKVAFIKNKQNLNK